jgi:hypothetical protein
LKLLRLRGGEMRPDRFTGDGYGGGLVEQGFVWTS